MRDLEDRGQAHERHETINSTREMICFFPIIVILMY